MQEKVHHAWNRIPRWALVSTGAVAVMATVAYGAAGYYLSSEVLKPVTQTVNYDQTVRSIADDAIRTQGGAYAINGQVGLLRSGDVFVGELGRPADSDADAQESTRPFLNKPAAEVAVGDKVSLQGNIWTSDPRRALGVPFEAVQYRGPLGDMDAWVIPGQKSDTWTIGVHGIGAPRSEMLRFVRPVLDSGNSMMVINYRNDAGSPKSPDGFTHLGDTEWQDVRAAVDYAKAQGATTINLYGVSLGASVVQNYLRQAQPQDTEGINKVILDSPALDWKQLLKYRVEQRGYPGWLVKPGFTVASLRSGIDFGRISTLPGSIKHETLIIHSSDDTTVPNGPSKSVADAQPGLVRLVDFGQGGHARSWNHDPARYGRLVTYFLQK